MRLSPTRLFVAEANCLWPFRADVQPKPEPENAKMRRGKEIHRMLELRIRNRVCPDSDHDMIEAAYEWQSEKGPGARWVETTFGVDMRTGESHLFKNKDAVPKDWMPVVTDLIISGEGILEIWDWKTGSPFSSFSYEPQVRANAYAAAAHLNKDEAVTGLAYVTPTGIKAKSWDLDAFDFADQKRKLRIWAEQAPTAKPNPGAACKYCPARTICPEQTPAAHR